AAAAGDERARRVTRRYQHRPELELYDVVTDPLNLENLAGDPKHEGVIRELKAKIDTWMRSQGDRGIETEMDAENRQTRALRPARATSR
ncbi:MAG: sulfatase atsG, partial [Planctomycetes bacterium]|nr:sulfatase atsG [Planctomycetota bacterium]